MAGQKGGKKGRKIGRNKKWCESYRKRGTEEINRRRRWHRVIKEQPDNYDLRKRYKATFGDLPADLR
jgi:hypothetical protein